MRYNKILVTGATGFLGSNLLKSLFDNKYEVIIIKRLGSRFDRLEGYQNRIEKYSNRDTIYI